VLHASNQREDFLLDLPQVTLCSVDGINHVLALRALTRCRERVRFARTIFLTSTIPPDVDVPAGVEVIEVGSIESQLAYSSIVLKGIYPHLRTPHVLLVQWDGYVVHPEMWRNDFLYADYLGAAWPNQDSGFSVGNGGFSLRSKKLLAALQDPRFELLTTNEDVTICGFHRPHLESEFGIRFGVLDSARQFSFEMETPYVLGGAKTFGFHGIFNLFLVENERAIVAFALQLSDTIARLPSIALLLQNLVKFQMWEAALIVAQRMLAADPENAEVGGIVVRVRERVALHRAASTRSRQNMVNRFRHRFSTRWS